MKSVIIVDYGMGNMRSVWNAFKTLGAQPKIGSDPEEIKRSDAIVLPGVGAFGEAMKNLRSQNLVDPLRNLVLGEGKPFLGICLGLQLLAEDSEELGHHSGLSWIKGSVKGLPQCKGHHVPHVGWNVVEQEEDSILYKNLPAQSSFYFDHSFYLGSETEIVKGRVEVGKPVVASIESGNVFATQFHPEKSQVSGLRLLRNFLNYI
jgi:imidazole glycerol-phosphate synthase subunit HisH